MPTDADRGQSIQIGAVLLFGILIVFLASWQAMVVPQENEDVEFNHNLQVQNDVQELRNAVVSAGDGSGPAAVDVRLGTAYPTRILFVNPGPPGGSLRTVGTASEAVNLSLENVTAPGDAGDFWNGTDRDYTTGGVVYTPNYNIYEEAPATTYENSVLYNDFGGRNLTVAGQRLVDGNRITLVTLNGSLSEARSGATTVDVRPVSASRNRLGVVNASASNRVTLAVPTHLSAANWSTLLEEQFVGSGGHVHSVSRGGSIPGTDLHVVKIHMERGVSYRLSLARVGVGTRVDTDVPAAYLTRTSGNGSVVPEGSTTTLEVRIWDRFTNPVGGVAVDASTTRPDSDVTVTDVSDDDGRVELQYEAPRDLDGSAEADEVNVSFAVQPSAAGENFDPETAPSATFDLTVDNTDGSVTGDPSGAYEIAWDFTTIESQQGVRGCFQANDTCVYDLDQDADWSFDMRAGTTPSVSGALVDFYRNNTYADISPGTANTDASGEVVTTFSVSSGATGVTQVNASTTEANDGVTVKVVNSSVGDAPTVTSATITNSPIGESEAGTTQSVTVTYDQAMDTSVDPTVEITGLASSPYSVSSTGWSDSTIWTGTVTIDDDDEETTATISVADGQDVDGNTQVPNPDTSNTFQVDTLAPQDPSATTVRPDPINASEETSVDVDVTFPSQPEAGTVEVRLAGPNGGTVTASTAADTGSTTTTVSGIDVSSLDDGTVTADARITDSVGNENPAGFTATSTATKDTVAPTIDVTYPADGATVRDTQVNITATLADATTGVDPSTIRVTVEDSNTGDGAEFDGAGTGAAGITYDSSTGTLAINASEAGETYAAGQVNVSITTADVAGNTGSENSSFSVVAVIDNFEDGDITEYTGDTNQFQTATSPVSDGTWALEATPTGNALKRITSTGGLPHYPHQDDRFAFAVRKPPHSGSPWTGTVGFGRTNAGDRYTVSVVQQGSGNIYQLEVSNGTSVRQSGPFTFSDDEWHQITVDWGTSDVTATIEDSTGSALGSATVGHAGDTGDLVSFASQRGTTYFDFVRLVE